MDKNAQNSEVQPEAAAGSIPAGEIVSQDVLNVLGERGLVEDFQRSTTESTGAPPPETPLVEGNPQPPTDAKAAEAESKTALAKAAVEAAKAAGKNEDDIAADEAIVTLEAEALAARAAAAGKTLEEQAALESNPTPTPPPSGEPTFTDEQKAWLSKQASDNKARQDALEAEKAKLQARVEELESRKAPVSSDMHPFLEMSAQQLSDTESKLERLTSYLIENWDGVEETPAQDGKAGTSAMSARDVRSLYAKVQKDLKLIPQVRMHNAAIVNQNTFVKSVYPDLFSPQHKDARTAQTILERLPALRNFPNYMLVIGDALAGERIRLGNSGKTKFSNAVLAAAHKMPKVPTPSGAPAVRIQGTRNSSELSAQRLEELIKEKGGDEREALTALFS
jgi:hypothetical protein